MSEIGTYIYNTQISSNLYVETSFSGEVLLINVSIFKTEWPPFTVQLSF